jgi:hypothetical protein
MSQKFNARKMAPLRTSASPQGGFHSSCVVGYDIVGQALIELLISMIAYNQGEFLSALLSVLTT